jgi:hypothetical protein
MDSYWPMLYTIYSEINKLPVQLHIEFTKFHNELKGLMEIVLRTIKSNLLGRNDITKTKEEEDLDKYKEPPGATKFEWKKKHYALICWVCICILASFLAVLFVVIVGLTIIQSNMVKEEEICKKLELIDVDKQDRTEGNSSNIDVRNRKLKSPLDFVKN